MQAVWNRFEKWLDANTPTGYGNLRHGADQRAIEAAEIAIGMKFPDQLTASYLIHDGQDDGPGLIGGERWLLMRLDEIVSQWLRWSESDLTAACLVPIAVNVMSDYVLLHLDVASHHYGRLVVQRRDSIELVPLAPSLLVWLDQFVDQLEDGVFLYSNDDGMIVYADELGFGRLQLPAIQ